jgi:hypothetical protein
MAKKDKKKSKKKDNPGADAVGAVRSAVEKTFHATADSAQSTRSRAQDLVDEVAGAAVRLREMIEQVGVLEDLKKQVEGLARRVQALEGGGASKPAASKPAASRSAASKPAARSRAKASSSTTRKRAASRKRASSSRPKAASSKPASRSTRKPTTSSSSTAAKKPSSS